MEFRFETARCHSRYLSATPFLSEPIEKKEYGFFERSPMSYPHQAKNGNRVLWNRARSGNSPFVLIGDVEFWQISSIGNTNIHRRSIQFRNKEFNLCLNWINAEEKSETDVVNAIAFKFNVPRRCHIQWKSNAFAPSCRVGSDEINSSRECYVCEASVVWVWIWAGVRRICLTKQLPSLHSACRIYFSFGHR